MKKRLLIATTLIGLLSASVSAEVSVMETTNANYLKNNGYSAQTTDIVNISKNRATGTKYYTKGEKSLKKTNGFCRFWRKLYIYTDPAAEDYSFYHHDTHESPIYTDL